jgi:hypothetical protein
MGFYYISHKQNGNFSKKRTGIFHIKETNKMRLKLLMWHAAEVDRLHVERNMLVGVNFLVIYRMRLKLLIWHVAEVDRLHVERNMLVGVNFLVI